MKKAGILRCMKALAAAAALTIVGAFTALAGSAGKTPVPVTLHLDVNNRQTAIYDGYTSYVMGNRVSDKDTFTITKDRNDVNLDEIVLNYYLITYEGDTQKSLECRCTDWRRESIIRSYARKHWQRKAKAGSMILWSGAMFLNLPEEMSEDPIILCFFPRQRCLPIGISI